MSSLSQNEKRLSQTKALIWIKDKFNPVSYVVSKEHQEICRTIYVSKNIWLSLIVSFLTACSGAGSGDLVGGSQQDDGGSNEPDPISGFEQVFAGTGGQKVITSDGFVLSAVVGENVETVNTTADGFAIEAIIIE